MEHLLKITASNPTATIPLNRNVQSINILQIKTVNSLISDCPQGLRFTLKGNGEDSDCFSFQKPGTGCFDYFDILQVLPGESPGNVPDNLTICAEGFMLEGNDTVEILLDLH